MSSGMSEPPPQVLGELAQTGSNSIIQVVLGVLLLLAGGLFVQLSRRADFYHQLGQLTGAGLGLVRALEELKRHPPDRSYREPIGQLLDQIAGGATLTDGVQRCGHWLPAFDLALLEAGEHCGRLDASFRLLADYYTDRARTARCHHRPRRRLRSAGA
jgi:LPXTG-motif cell wall-anchored protein